MEKIDIKDLSKAELAEGLVKLGAERYRARQIFKWLYRVGAASFDDMSDIPSDLRELLRLRFHISRLVLLDTRRSKIDGTEKFLFKLRDANTIETVSLPEPKRRTVCISSQVGCKYACSFCASAPFGFVRNLSVSEVLDQVLFVKVREGALHITNIVFMGIGEPLDNYDNVMKAIRRLNDKDAFGIGSRRITISTCGIIPAMERLKEEGLQIELSVSLHAATDSLRSRLVPINKRYPLKDLINACKDYIKMTNRIITFEYVLIKDVNSSREDALRLARLLKGIKCKVNTILCNQIAVKRYQAPSSQEAIAFVKALTEEGVAITHRESKGEDIEAGCGQLRISTLR